MNQIFLKKVLSIMLVLVFAAGTLSPATYAYAQDEEPQRNLVQLAYAVNQEGSFAGQFDTLFDAIMAADPLVLETLSSSDEDYTVFAPTDDAFSALGIDETNVNTMPVEDLTQILLYHVAQGQLLAEDVLMADQIETLQGGSISQEDGTLTDSQGRVVSIIATDLLATNGVIHAIDGVLLPFSPAE